MQISSDLILDAISLYIGGRNNSSYKKIVTDFIKIIDDNNNGTIGIPESLDMISQLYLDVLKTLLNEDIDTDKNDNSILLSTLLKYEANTSVQKNPSTQQTFERLSQKPLRLMI